MHSHINVKMIPGFFHGDKEAGGNIGHPIYSRG